MIYFGGDEDFVYKFQYRIVTTYEGKYRVEYTCFIGWLSKLLSGECIWKSLGSALSTEEEAKDQIQGHLFADWENKIRYEFNRKLVWKVKSD